MPQRDTNVFIKQAINFALNATQGHKPSLSNKLYVDPKLWEQFALNATQGQKPSYQQAIYLSQMMGTIWPAYQNRGLV